MSVVWRHHCFLSMLSDSALTHGIVMLATTAILLDTGVRLYTTNAVVMEWQDLIDVCSGDQEKVLGGLTGAAAIHNPVLLTWTLHETTDTSDSLLSIRLRPESMSGLVYTLW